ncbi:MAG: hypothetical protein Q7K54_03600 [Candidatus Parcubacteria bacterium]|nr:hypothetical protein [Candidatus Parcubacteria bacterium]
MVTKKFKQVWSFDTKTLKEAKSLAKDLRSDGYMIRIKPAPTSWHRSRGYKYKVLQGQKRDKK